MSTADTYDDDLEPEDDDQGQDDSPVIRKLRKAARAGEKHKAEADTLRAENRQLKATAALSAAGLKLNERQQRALLREFDGNDEITPELIRQAAVEYGWAEAEPDVDADEEAAQRRIVEATAGGRNSNPAAEGVVTPKDFASWDMARRVDFMNRQPEKFAALERGESVRV